MKKFADKAYDLLRKVPAGRVTTYREIAHALGTKAYASERANIPTSLCELRRDKTTQQVELRRDGFNVYCSNAIWPHNEDGLASGS